MSKKTTTKRSPRRTVTSPNESGHDKFKRLAHRRLQRVVDTIILLGNLSSPTYKYTDAEVAGMEKAINTAVAESFARFRPRKDLRTRVDVSAIFSGPSAQGH